MVLSGFYESNGGYFSSGGATFDAYLAGAVNSDVARAIRRHNTQGLFPNSGLGKARGLSVR